MNKEDQTISCKNCGKLMHFMLYINTIGDLEDNNIASNIICNECMEKLKNG